jgi:hypothetical protein
MNTQPLPEACSESEALRLLNWSTRRTEELRGKLPNVSLIRGRVYERAAVEALRTREAGELVNRAVNPVFVPVPLHTR